MNINKLNDLFFEIFLNGNVLSFDELYQYGIPYMQKHIEELYTEIKDKDLYLVEDIVNQSWLNFWLYSNKNRVRIYFDEDFESLLFSIAKDTIIEINN